MNQRTGSIFSVGAAIATAVFLSFVLLHCTTVETRWTVVFADFGLKLPWITQAWIDFSHFMIAGFGFILFLPLPIAGGFAVGGFDRLFGSGRWQDAPRRVRTLFWMNLCLIAVILFWLFMGQVMNLPMLELLTGLTGRSAR